MRIRVVLCALVISSLAGCKATTTQAAPRLIQESLGGYNLEYEIPGGVDYSRLSNWSDDGRGNEITAVTISSGDKQQQLQIHNGDITINGVSCGACKKGDRIKLTADGKVFVNGTERTP